MNIIIDTGYLEELVTAFLKRKAAAKAPAEHVLAGG